MSSRYVSGYFLNAESEQQRLLPPLSFFRLQLTVCHGINQADQDLLRTSNFVELAENGDEFG